MDKGNEGVWCWYFAIKVGWCWSVDVYDGGCARGGNEEDEDWNRVGVLGHEYKPIDGMREYALTDLHFIWVLDGIFFCNTYSAQNLPHVQIVSVPMSERWAVVVSLYCVLCL